MEKTGKKTYPPPMPAAVEAGWNIFWAADPQTAAKLAGRLGQGLVPIITKALAGLKTDVGVAGKIAAELPAIAKKILKENKNVARR